MWTRWIKSVSHNCASDYFQVLLPSFLDKSRATLLCMYNFMQFGILVFGDNKFVVIYLFLRKWKHSRKPVKRRRQSVILWTFQKRRKWVRYKGEYNLYCCVSQPRVTRKGKKIRTTRVFSCWHHPAMKDIGNIRISLYSSLYKKALLKGKPKEVKYVVARKFNGTLM